MNHVRVIAAVLAALAGQASMAAQSQGAARPVDIGMHDSMRFLPDQLSVARGEAIRFMVRNEGKVLHEIVIGTAAEIARHRSAMRQDPTMAHAAHAAPHMTHVAPGKREQLVWRFERAGDYEYACLLPGHYEAGMKGTIVVH